MLGHGAYFIYVLHDGGFVWDGNAHAAKGGE